MPATLLEPLILGTSEQFARLRGILDDGGYTEAATVEGCGARSIYEISVDRDATYVLKPFTSRFDLLHRMLMLGQLGRESDVLKVLSPDELELFEELGVIGRREDDSALLYATAAIYPVENVYVASDRPYAPDPEFKGAMPTDLVFSAISFHTRWFIGSIPRGPCERLLDVCAGSGIGALLAGKNFARQAWAADLGPRCVRFAEFSRRLNGLENVTTARGDLYGAAPGLQFDRIIAHPPFIPAKNRTLLLRDGGQDGEQIFRALVQGLPEVLAPGGRFHCVTFGTDRTTGQLEDRVRSWLGPAESGFDIIVVAFEVSDRTNPPALRPGLRRSESEDMFDELGVTALVHGSVVIQRKPAERPAFSARTLRYRKTPLSEVEAYRRMVTLLHEPQALAGLAGEKPVLPQDLTVTVTHRFQNGGFVPAEHVIKTGDPWIAEGEVEPVLVAFLSLCDGNRSLTDIHRQMKAAGAIGGETSFEEFWTVARRLAVHGFIKFPRLFAP